MVDFLVTKDSRKCAKMTPWGPNWTQESISVISSGIFGSFKPVPPIGAPTLEMPALNKLWIANAGPVISDPDRYRFSSNWLKWSWILHSDFTKKLLEKLDNS